MDRERWKERESGVRGQEFEDLKPQASSLKPSFATDEHKWNWEAGPDEGPDSIGIGIGIGIEITGWE